MRPETEEGELRRKAAAGARQGAAATVVVAAFSFLQNAVLARLLTPRDFGLAAMLWTVLGLAQLISDAGLSNVLLFEQRLGRRAVSTVFWLALLASTVLAGAAWVAAPWLVWFNQEPALGPLVPWAALGFWLQCAGAPLRTLVQRDLRFRALAWMDTAGAAAALGVAVFAAWRGSGILALLWAGIAAAALKLLLAVWTLRASGGFPIGFEFDGGVWRRSVKFSALQLADRVANFAWSNLDYLLIGRVLGAGPLGQYRMAYELAVRPLSYINPVFNSVAYPIFARKQDDPAALRRGFLEAIGWLATIVLPLMAGLAVTSREAVRVLFGPGWEEAAGVLPVLCLLGALRSLQNPVGALVVATGHAGAGLLYNGGLLVLYALALPLAVPRGTGAVAAAAAGATLLAMIVLWKPVYGRMIQLPALAWWRAITRPALFSIGMGLATGMLLGALPEYWPAGGRLAVAVPAGMVTYASCWYWQDRNQVMRLLALIRPGSSR